MANISQKLPQNATQSEDADSWMLTTEQMIFMLQYHNAIELAYVAEDVVFLRDLAASADYKSIFGQMSWDEAYDRYEEILMNNTNADSQLAS